MEQFIAAVITELLKYGLRGLAMAYLIYENRQLKADVEAKAKNIEELQEKRVNRSDQDRHDAWSERSIERQDG
jgi:hypothetical protein